MANKYQKMMERIQAPGKLTDQVLLAAARQDIQRGGKHMGMRKKHGPVLRAALCAAAALVLIAGAAMFPLTRQETIPDSRQSGPVTSVQPAAPSALSFQLTAYAADLGEQYPAGQDGSLAMGSGSGMYWQERDGFFTGSLFRVTGEDIRTVSLSLDRGGFYSYRIVSGLTEEQRREIREAQGRGELAPASIDQDGSGVWSFQEMIPLGNHIEENYDPNTWYGLWSSGGESGDDMRKDFEDHTNAFDGGLLTVTVTFTDGTEQTSAYRLHTGRLRTAANADGPAIPLPELAGEDEPYIYGVYAVPEQ